MTALLLAGLFTPLVTLAETPLFHLVVSDQPVENGKVLDMEFHEIERDADGSTVQIIRRSGGSVSSSMFIVRGLCGVVRSRGKQYVVSEPVAGEGVRYRLTFPDTPPEQGKGWTIAQCDLLGF